ncbi:peptidase M23 [Methylorubrum populi]|uniref:Peptidase M23 n=1 Tax=Methylorubrum populi TaxID=223967 RepID=A0A160PJK4_9HYPH|nr:M23 family metallopeptidase [Methylorubrum populi]BAU93204.1 peptidase M23 [Methylorubrum populi]
MPVRGKVLGLRTLSRFALIGMIGGGTAACSSDASRLGDPFTNPFASLSGEPSATGSLPAEGSEGEMAAAPAIRTPRIQSQALPAPGPALSPRPGAMSAAAPRAATRVATAEPISGGMASSVSGLNPDSGRAMTPRAPAPQPKLQFGKPVDKAAEKAAEKRAAEAAAAKAADARREAERQAAAAKIAEAKAAEAKAAEKAAQSKKLAEAKKVADAKAHPRPGQKGAEKTVKAETKPDPKDVAKEAAKAEAARKAEAEAKQAKADAAKKLAEARAAEAAAKAAAKESKEAAKAPAKEAAPVKVASADASAPIPAAAAPQAPAESFRWPAKGRIINGYGSSGNEGINIAVPEGTPVKAAEDGTVAYAGSDVKGYGKLVLVRHNNGYVSAYAHNGELDVRPGEKVKRGQTIAKSGATGNVTSPQLHFELRKGATPVDPMPHLGG